MSRVPSLIPAQISRPLTRRAWTDLSVRWAGASTVCVMVRCVDEVKGRDRHR
jgi:hypothetical protein